MNLSKRTAASYVRKLKGYLCYVLVTAVLANLLAYLLFTKTSSLTLAVRNRTATAKHGARTTRFDSLTSLNGSRAASQDAPESTTSSSRLLGRSARSGVNVSRHRGTGTLAVSQNADGDASAKLLCVRFSGRLGNQLFVYASTLGLALTSRRKPVFLGKNVLRSILERFPNASDQPLLEARCKKAEFLREQSCCKFDDHLTRLDPNHDYEIAKYLQSYRYFANHEAEIRKAIEFNSRIGRQTSSVVRQLRHAYSSYTLIGVHIRRGDMVTVQYQKMGYTVPDAAYVRRALAYFRGLYPRCVFVVATDSMPWCKRNFPEGYRVHYLTRHEEGVDMSVAASMDHTIISFGTFSWWIGFLNAGKTVYMKNYVRNDTFIGLQFHPDGRDFLYSDWIPV